MSRYNKEFDHEVEGNRISLEIGDTMVGYEMFIYEALLGSGMSVSEVADSLKVSTSTVYNRLSRLKIRGFQHSLELG